MPTFPRKQTYRFANLTSRLLAQAQALEAIPRAERRTPMKKRPRGEGRRLIAEAKALVPLSPAALDDPAMPGDLMASTLSALLSLSTLSRHANKQSRDEMGGTFPRRSHDW
jgi:hypothetical protein